MPWPILLSNFKLSMLFTLFIPFTFKDFTIWMFSNSRSKCFVIFKFRCKTNAFFCIITILKNDSIYKYRFSPPSFLNLKIFLMLYNSYSISIKSSLVHLAKINIFVKVFATNLSLICIIKVKSKLYSLIIVYWPESICI